MDLHRSSARSSNKNSQRWSIFLYLCRGHVGTEQVWTGRAPEGSTTLLHCALSSMSFLSLKPTILFAKKRKCEQESNCWPDMNARPTVHGLKTCLLLLLWRFAHAGGQLTRPTHWKHFFTSWNLVGLLYGFWKGWINVIMSLASLLYDVCMHFLITEYDDSYVLYLNRCCCFTTSTLLYSLQIRPVFWNYEFTCLTFELKSLPTKLISGHQGRLKQSDILMVY